jgi:hypothetical protein
MENLTNLVGTHGEGGKRKVFSKARTKGKDKMKGVVDLDANTNAFVDVPLQETIAPSRVQYFETKYIKTSISPSYSFSWWKPKYIT